MDSKSKQTTEIKEKDRSYCPIKGVRVFKELSKKNR